MNDEFLRSIRKTPPPEFLAGLKARLDRQPLAPPPRRRWTFTRGLLTGLLLGGAAFALTAVSLTGGRPGSVGAFVSAPVRFLARLMPGGNGTAEDPEQDYPTHAVPLGPVWLPEHPAAGARAGAPPDRGKMPTASTSLAAQQGSGGGGGNSAASRSSGGVGGGIPGLPAFESLRVVTPSTLFPVVSQAADNTNKLGYGRVRVDLDTGNDFDSLCTIGAPSVDVIELPRRITREELGRCNGRPRYIGVVEVKLGYQGLALARSQLYGPMKLSARDLFLALARRIPDPSHPEAMMDNPNTAWNQVNAALPNDRIQILGPAAGSTQGKLVADLLLKSGCNSYPWIAALRESDPARHEEICGTLRDDGVYATTGGASGWAYANELATNPTAIGIFSLNEFRTSHDGLALSLIDGIEPTEANIAAGTYPGGRTLYLYANDFRSLGNQIFMSFVRYNMLPWDLYGRNPNGWGFIALDKAESDANLAIAGQRKGLKF
jgi:phosphate transport system substrate-binding protein